MARGIFKGRPSSQIHQERLRLLAGTQMSAREWFEVRTAERLRDEAAANLEEAS